MHVAITQANGPTIVVGTDCPFMTAAHLRDAAEVLRGGSDAVIFPAEDGGYVLIGMRRRSGAVHQLPWSTEGGMLETRQRLRHLGLSWREPVRHLWDVDRPTDVMRMRREGLTDLLAGIDRREKR